MSEQRSRRFLAEATRDFLSIIVSCCLQILLVVSFFNQPPMAYRFGAYHPELAHKIGLNESLVYQFPAWSNGVVWGLRGLQLLPIPLVALLSLCYYKVGEGGCSQESCIGLQVQFCYLGGAFLGGESPAEFHMCYSFSISSRIVSVKLFGQV